MEIINVLKEEMMTHKECMEEYEKQSKSKAKLNFDELVTEMDITQEEDDELKRMYAAAVFYNIHKGKYLANREIFKRISIDEEIILDEKNKSILLENKRLREENKILRNCIKIVGVPDEEN